MTVDNTVQSTLSEFNGALYVIRSRLVSLTCKSRQSNQMNNNKTLYNSEEKAIKMECGVWGVSFL